MLILPSAEAVAGNHRSRDPPCRAPVAGITAAECPGTQIAAAASSGNLCVYETHCGNSTFEEIFADSTGGESIGPYGFGIFFTTSGSGGAWDYGTWAVTG